MPSYPTSFPSVSLSIFFLLFLYISLPHSSLVHLLKLYIYLILSHIPSLSSHLSTPPLISIPPTPTLYFSPFSCSLSSPPPPQLSSVTRLKFSCSSLVSSFSE